MASGLDAATIFNLAQLSLHVPPAATTTGPSPAPTLTTASALASANTAELDDWVTRISEAPEREQAYYDESLPFYLVLRLPPFPVLTRAQAAILLLPFSTASETANNTTSPHLTLSCDVTYVEGRPGAPGPSHHPPPPPARSSSISGTSALGLGGAPRRPSEIALAAALGPKVPLTPSPFPSTRARDAQFIGGGEADGVPLWSSAFVTAGMKRKRGGEEEGRVWVGKEGGEEGDGPWIGVWEFRGDVAFIRSHLVSPRLCITLTTTFRDDPRLLDLLERASAENLVDGASSDLANGLEEDEYMTESYDDVNLLAGLSSTFSGASNFAQPSLHLPASRLPQPFAPTDQAPPSRRPSRSLSISYGANDTPLHPSIRRAVRRVMRVRSALNVKMRTVPCPVAGLAGDGIAGIGMGVGMVGLGSEGSNEMDGLVMCVEVEGGSGVAGDAEEEDGEEGDGGGFEIESVSVQVTGGAAGLGDVEIKEIVAERADDTFPLFLGTREQHNFLYAVTFSSAASAAQGISREDQLFAAAPSPLPITVATSPSQRFTARFGDEDQAAEAAGQNSRDRLAREGGKQVERNWLRSVAIIVKGRPVRVVGGSTRRREDGQDSTRSLTGAYTVPGVAEAPVVDEDEEPTFDTPTETFASRWNCTLDISPFAQRTPPKDAIFTPAPPPHDFSASAVPLSTRLSTLSLASPASKRNSRASEPIEFEAIAGSKRHTMASLASLALKSPVLSRTKPNRERPPSLTSLPRFDSARALPPTPFDISTPGATGPSRRFFSLPAAGGSVPGTPSSPPAFNRSGSEVPSTPAYPPHSGPRASLPAFEPLRHAGQGAISTEAKRETWAHGGAAPSFELREEDRGGLMLDGLGMDGVPGGRRSRAMAEGNILVSVALMPLRAVKTRPLPPSSATAPASPAIEFSPDLSESALSPNPGGSTKTATFKFPSPQASPILGGSPSPSPSPTPDAQPAKEPQWRTPRVGLLDVFLVECFVLNLSNSVKRFTVGVPVKRGDEGQKKADERVGSLVALENDVRIGPLAPQTCQSVRLRFLAIRPGAHTLDELRLVDTGTGLETRLKNPLSVVVEA